MKTRCQKCGKEPALSPTIRKCEACLYAEEMGEDAARRQYVQSERAKRRAASTKGGAK